jgi:hypothetical protein
MDSLPRITRLCWDTVVRLTNEIRLRIRDAVYSVLLNYC